MVHGEGALREDRFASGRPITGLEIELNLVDDAAQPDFVNGRVLEAIDDPEYQTELAKFNIELNVAPRPLPGNAARLLEDDLRVSLNHADERARTAGARIAMVGVEDLIVVASGSDILILPRGRSQDVKLLQEEMKRR